MGMAEFFGIFRKKGERPDVKPEGESAEAGNAGYETLPGEAERGKLIVFEGNDGSGKRTQVNLLAERLRQDSKNVEILDFPDYTSFYGKLIRRYLGGQFGNEVSPYLISMAYANDRLRKKSLLKKFLAEGKIVLCNRYVASNKAHLAVRLGSVEEMQSFVKWVDDMEYEVNKIPRPDLTIYLNVPSDIAFGMVQQRSHASGRKEDIHEKLPYMKRVEQVYLAMARNKNWMKVDCMRENEMLTKDEVSDKVYDIVINLV